jgi:hypothetical protein
VPQDTFHFYFWGFDASPLCLELIQGEVSIWSLRGEVTFSAVVVSLTVMGDAASGKKGFLLSETLLQTPPKVLYNDEPVRRRVLPRITNLPARCRLFPVCPA